MMRSDEMNKGDRVQVTGWEEAKGRYGTVDAVTVSFVDVTLDGGEQLCFHRLQLTKVSDAAEPLTPHMTRIRELEALVDFLREHPVVTARIDGVRACLSEFEHRRVTTDEIVEMKEAMGVEMDHPAHDGHVWRLRREFGGIELVIQVPASLCGQQQSSFVLDERLAPADNGMTMDELTARRDEIVAEVTAADRGGELQNAPADSPARQPRHPDVVMGGGLVVPGNHPLMSMLTAAVEADKPVANPCSICGRDISNETVLISYGNGLAHRACYSARFPNDTVSEPTASQEMNAVVDQRTLAEEAILADIFGL
jgi:hypothetical protein